MRILLVKNRVINLSLIGRVKTVSWFIIQKCQIYGFVIWSTFRSEYPMCRNNYFVHFYRFITVRGGPKVLRFKAISRQLLEQTNPHSRNWMLSNRLRDRDFFSILIKLMCIHVRRWYRGDQRGASLDLVPSWSCY